MCYLYFFCLHCCLINIHIFDYPDSRLSGLFTEVPTSPDNRGSNVALTNYPCTQGKFFCWVFNDYFCGSVGISNYWNSQWFVAWLPTAFLRHTLNLNHGNYSFQWCSIDVGGCPKEGEECNGNDDTRKGLFL